MKEYDFIFNAVKKDFFIDNEYVSLERHLIFSELLLEYILCFALSTILYFLYMRFKFKTISIFLYLLFCTILTILWSYKINDVLLKFRPTYDKVLNKESEIKNRYGKYISDISVYIFLSKFKIIYYNDYSLDYWTEDIWEKIGDDVVIPQNMLPGLNEFISIKVKSSSNTQRTNRYSRQRYFNPDWGDYLDIERVKKYYPNFILPKGKTINSSELYNSIDKIKLKYFIDSLKKDFDYFTIRDNYFKSLNDFWTTVKQINYYGRYVLIVFFSFLLWIQRRIIINKSALYIEKLFVEDRKASIDKA